MAESYHDSSLRLNTLLPKQQKEVSKRKAVAAWKASNNISHAEGELQYGYGSVKTAEEKEGLYLPN